MHYAIYGPDGIVRRSGTHPEDEAHNIKLEPGERIYHGRANPGDTIDETSGRVYAAPEPMAPGLPPDYLMARIAAYPSLQSQMDSLWHAMDQGVLPKAEPFYSQIKAVKDAYPKDYDLRGRMPEPGGMLPPFEEL